MNDLQNMPELKGNKGEWSEVYVLLKLLADGKLNLADADLNFIENLCLPIIRIIRANRGNGNEYVPDDGHVRVISQASQSEVVSLPVNDFLKNASILLSKLKGKTPTTFAVTEISAFLSQIRVTSLAASGRQKSDIRIVVHDINSGIDMNLGYSIKSLFGSPPTLFNASQSTNFVFDLVSKRGRQPVSIDVNAINAISETPMIMRRIEVIRSSGYDLRFLRVNNAIFHRNLVLVDSKLPEIFAHLLMVRFSMQGVEKLSDLISRINTDDPLAFGMQSGEHPFYAYKVKNFLTDVALGMKPSQAWDGLYDATGGFLVVRQDGEIACYHICYRNQLQDYFFHNTKIGQPSTTRNQYGFVYQDGDSYRMNLNLSIRYC